MEGGYIEMRLEALSAQVIIDNIVAPSVYASLS